MTKVTKTLSVSTILNYVQHAAKKLICKHKLRNKVTQKNVQALLNMYYPCNSKPDIEPANFMSPHETETTTIIIKQQRFGELTRPA